MYNQLKNSFTTLLLLSPLLSSTSRPSSPFFLSFLSPLFFLCFLPLLFMPCHLSCWVQVEAMGGTGSSEYQSFRKYCYITFQALRR